MFTIPGFLMVRSATDLIYIENFLSAEIGKVTNFRYLNFDRWLKSVIEIGSLNQPQSREY